MCLHCHKMSECYILYQTVAHGIFTAAVQSEILMYYVSLLNRLMQTTSLLLLKLRGNISDVSKSWDKADNTQSIISAD